MAGYCCCPTLQHFPQIPSDVKTSLRTPHRPQSSGEEIANSLSHGLGFIVALIAAPFLILSADQRGDPGFLVGASIFATTMGLLYLTSTLYHALPQGRTKRVLQIIEHSAIFLLIAGTYTPFTLGILRGAWGWTLLGIVWGLAVTGVLLKAFDRLLHPGLSTGLYLVMGWLILIAAVPLLEHLPTPGLMWLAAGGLAYTLGVVFFALDSLLRYSHFIWHLFVITGTACHYVAILHYAA